MRFERTQKVSDDDHRSADAGQRTVFVDAVNSIGAFDVPAGSRVAVSGRLIPELRDFERQAIAPVGLL